MSNLQEYLATLRTLLLPEMQSKTGDALERMNRLAKAHPAPDGVELWSEEPICYDPARYDMVCVYLTIGENTSLYDLQTVTVV